MRALLAVVVTAALAVSVQAQIPSAASPAEETPTQFYMRYLAAVSTATAADQIVAFWSAEQAGAYNAAPASDRMGLDELKRAYGRHTNVEVVMEAATPDRATLSLEGLTTDHRRATGTAQLIRERGVWKMTGPERWTAP